MLIYRHSINLLYVYKYIQQMFYIFIESPDKNARKNVLVQTRNAIFIRVDMDEVRIDCVYYKLVRINYMEGSGSATIK